MPARCRTITGLILLGAILGAAASPARNIHVGHQAVGPVHDGSSWCTAFVQLHEAVALATEGSMIRVAEGVYLPVSPEGPEG